MFNPYHNKDHNSDIIKCKYCGEEITFRKEICGKNGKMIPLNLDLTSHTCRGRTPQEQSRSESQKFSPKFHDVTDSTHTSKIRASPYDKITENMDHFNSLYEQILIEWNKTTKQIESNSELLKKILDHVSSQHPGKQLS